MSYSLLTIGGHQTQYCLVIRSSAQILKPQRLSLKRENQEKQNA